MESRDGAILEHHFHHPSHLSLPCALGQQALPHGLRCSLPNDHRCIDASSLTDEHGPIYVWVGAHEDLEQRVPDLEIERVAGFIEECVDGTRRLKKHIAVGCRLLYSM